jgi:hypothetical protein
VPVVGIFRPVQQSLIQCFAFSQHDSEGSYPEDRNNSYSIQN